MNESRDRRGRHVKPERLLERVDKMVEAGRITEEDAGRLRAGAESGELDDAVQGIRLKHARARVDAGVAEGRLTGEEAEAAAERLEEGEDPRFVLDLLRERRPPTAGR